MITTITTQPPRTIGVVTVARSDYSIYTPILHRIHADPSLRLHLMVSGMHFSPEFGMTVNAIEADGLPIAERIEMLLASDSPNGISQSVGLGVIGFSQAFARQRPDILLVLGDRFEMLASVIATLPYKIPIAHLHGGEITEGAMDEAIRHAITKMSHVHFASTPAYARRIQQMGEESWRVHVSGAPALDNLKTLTLLNPHEFKQRFGVDIAQPTLLVTFHPVTLEFEHTEAHIQAVLEALETVDEALLFTYPNADTHGRLIIERIEAFVAQRPEQRFIVRNLGLQGYFSALAHATAMVGNSSSGIIEGASFGLPVVNIGNRQRGRDHAHNVLDVPNDTTAIIEALKIVTQPQFKASLQGMVNPYGDGNATDRILAVLKTVALDQRLIQKKFVDMG